MALSAVRSSSSVVLDNSISHVHIANSGPIVWAVITSNKVHHVAIIGAGAGDGTRDVLGTGLIPSISLRPEVGGWMIQETVDILLHPFVVRGVIAGLVVLVLGIAVAIARGEDGVQRFGGLLVAGAVTVVLYASEMLGLSQIVGVTLLAIAGLLGRSVAIRVLVAIPGAFFVIRPDVASASSWLPWFAMVAIILSAPLVASFDDRYRETGLSLPFLGIATLGVFLTVPDTEGAMVLLGVSGIAGFLGWPKPFMTLGASGSYAVVGVYTFVAADGASPRPASIIGAMAALGLLLIVPIVIRLRSTGWAHDLDRIDALFPLITQLLLVLLISRTAGRIVRVEGAAALTIALLAAVTAIMLRRLSHLPD